MLTRLAIRNIVLIDALDLQFGPGLGVLTGETGAGKSILLDALGLVLGNRAESALVRAGEDKASVTATFEFAAFPPALAAVLDGAGVEIEPGEALVIRRQLKPDGGSKAWVNDQPAGAALLRELAGSLVELHGQHDDRGLVNPRGHRALLDRFAGADALGVARAWESWRAGEAALAEARASVETAKADQDLLLAHLAELTALEPKAGEAVRLADRRAAMQKGERLSSDLEGLRHVWDGSDSPLATLRVAARRLDRIAAEHPLLAEALAALDRAVIESGEAEEKLRAAAEANRHGGNRKCHETAGVQDGRKTQFVRGNHELQQFLRIFDEQSGGRPRCRRLERSTRLEAHIPRPRSSPSSLRGVRPLRRSRRTVESSLSFSSPWGRACRTPAPCTCQTKCATTH